MTEDVSAADDDRVVENLLADEATELAGHREEPLTLRRLKVKILNSLFGHALKNRSEFRFLSSSN